MTEMSLLVRSAAKPLLLLLTLLAIVAGGAIAHAQYRQQQVRPPVQQPEMRNPFTEFFNIFRPKPQAPPQQPPPSIRRPPPVVQAAPRRRIVAPKPPPVVVSDAPAPVQQATANTFVVVMGDTLAELLSAGLSDAFSENNDIDVTRKTRSSSGLVRDDFYDWRKAVTDLLGSNEKITYGVMMLGSNDRQPMKDATGAMLEPMTDAWKAAYAARVDDIVRAFADKNVPLFWVGMPIMQNARYSADMQVLNEIYRERVTRGGGTYVDIYDAFADDDGKFTMSGPAVTGETVRLRASDGVHFTKAGARKAAHFVEVELNRVLEQRQPAAVIALPQSDPASNDPALRPGGVERLIDEMARAGRDDPLDVPAIPSKPIAGPIIALTQPEIAADGALLGAPPQRAGSMPPKTAEKILVQGHAPDAKPGRADDFRWPIN